MGNIHIGPIYHLYSLNYAIDFLGVLDFPVGADDICRIIPIRVVRVSSAIARIKKKKNESRHVNQTGQPAAESEK